ncbi:LysR family transcriptional regulator [Jannaschia sp. S6380]|uniref:LysR family transcriptional regulator n=1 Tax=Jannaschia sp. S6380 TaxID=2926408 RepID=UPI00248A94DA|nr:LysR family transcriptional regulator [Jannaschia sp. S6380]
MPVRPRPAPDLPLNALRALEAAARLGGFAPAAAELGVAPNAVTAHVKALEERLGLPLFHRHPRGVQLTEAGRRALPALTAAFDALDQAKTHLRHEAAPPRLSVAALPAVAQLWLRPRLARLQAAIPGLSVSITAMEAPPAPKRSPQDIAIFIGPGGRDHIVPVAAPDAGQGPRLGDGSWADDWAHWQAGAGGVALPGSGAGPVHSLYALAVDDALQGAGVLMGRLSLIAGHLRAGRLAELGPRVAIRQGIEIAARNHAPLTVRAARLLRVELATGDRPGAAG